MATLAQFQRDLASFSVSIPEDVDEIKRKMALKVLQGVTLGTPVDTGRALGNWQVSVGPPITEETARRDKTGGATLSDGLGEISKVREGGTIWITNNVPYIIPLNDGSSQQAPKMFVERAINAAVASVKR